MALVLLNVAALAGLGLLGIQAGVGAAGLGLLAWLLGVRHAFDADHIAAIDNVTRHRRARGERPVAVGLFFSLGHASVVCVLTLAFAVAQRHVAGADEWAARWGVPAALLGSTLCLAVLSALNFSLLRPGRHARPPPRIAVPNSGAMFPLGLLFGLNLDTAAEVLLLVAAAAALPGVELSLAGVMALPLLFMAGMALADSAEGLLMLRLYDWAAADADRSLRLNTTLTVLSAALALGVATLQAWAFARWAGWNGPELALPDGGAAFGLGATVLMTALWALARRRRGPVSA